MGNNKALMATALIEDLTRLVEQHGDLPVLMGTGHTLITPLRPKVMRVVSEEHVKTTFICHRQLLGDLDTIPAIHLG
nr:MAG TPA: hypothetical protein [Caudoviricetes sp.]